VQAVDFTRGTGKTDQHTSGLLSVCPKSTATRLDLKHHLSYLSKADRLVGELRGVTRNLPDPHLLIGPFIRREAVLSSRIEGTQASLTDLFFFEASGEENPEVLDVREVANYVRALEFGLKRMEKFPLSLRLIKEMHAELMKGVRGEHMAPSSRHSGRSTIGFCSM